MTMKRASRETEERRSDERAERGRGRGHDHDHGHDRHDRTHDHGHRDRDRDRDLDRDVDHEHGPDCGHRARRPGRPRSEAAEKAIVEAVLDLLAEGVPYGVLSVEQIASRAGVGKATLYRRWANKESLVVSAVASLFVDCPMPDFDDGVPFRERLVEALRNIATGLSAERSGLVFGAVMAEGMRHPELVRKYQQTAIEPRRDVMRAILWHGQETGEVRADLDVERGLRLVVSPLLAFLKNEHLGEDVPEPVVHEFIDGIVDDVFRGFSPRPGDAGPGATGAAGR